MVIPFAYTIYYLFLLLLVTAIIYYYNILYYLLLSFFRVYQEYVIASLTEQQEATSKADVSSRPRISFSTARRLFSNASAGESGARVSRSFSAHARREMIDHIPVAAARKSVPNEKHVLVKAVQIG